MNGETAHCWVSRCNTRPRKSDKCDSEPWVSGDINLTVFISPLRITLVQKKYLVNAQRKMRGNLTNINVTPYELCAYNYNCTNHCGAILERPIASFQSRKADP